MIIISFLYNFSQNLNYLTYQKRERGNEKEKNIGCHILELNQINI